VPIRFLKMISTIELHQVNDHNYIMVSNILVVGLLYLLFIQQLTITFVFLKFL